MDRSIFLEALDKVKPSIAAKPYKPILSCFLFKDGKVLAYNDIVAIETELALEDFTGCVQGELLYKIASSMTSKEIKFSVAPEEGTSPPKIELTVKGDKSKFSTTVFDAVDFTFAFPEYRNNLVLPVDNGLNRGIKLCLLSTTATPNHPSEMGVTVHLNGATTKLFSTNNKSICKFETNVSINQGNLIFTLPTEFCTAFTDAYDKAYDKDNTQVARLYLTKDFVVAEIGATRIFANNVPNEKPLDFERVIRESTNECPAPRAVPKFLEAALSRAMVLEQDGNLRTAFKIERNKFTIYTKSQHGEIEDTDLPMANPNNPQAVVVFPDVAFATNPTLLDKVLSKFDKTEKAAITISFSPKAVRLNALGDKFEHLIACYGG